MMLQVILGMRVLCSLLVFLVFCALMLYRRESNSREITLLVNVYLAMYIYSVIMVFELSCRTMQSALYVRKLSGLCIYLMVSMMFLFCSKYTGILIRKSVMITMLLAGWISCGAMLVDSEYSHTFEELRFTWKGAYPHLLYRLGMWGHIFNTVVVSYAVGALYLALRYYREGDRKQEAARKRLLLWAMTIPFLCFGIYRLLLMTRIEIATNTLIVGFLMSGIILVFGVYHYGIFNTKVMAKENMVEFMQQGFIILDQNLHFLYANRKAKEIFPELQDLKEGNEIRNLDEWSNMQHFQKDDRYYEYSMNQVHDRSLLTGYSILIYDVTERQHFIDEQVMLRNQAEQENRQKSIFLANVSHDIRTPMNGILGMSEIALEMDMSDEVKHAVFNIFYSAKSLLNIVNTVLDMSKIESGKFEIHREQYDLDSILYDVSNVVDMNIHGKKIQYAMVVEDNVPNGLIGDSVCIRRILMNVLGNAVKYTKQGSIHLTVGAHWEKMECFVTFKIEDTGEGIKKQDLDKIFSRYEQAGVQRNRSVPGTGLGLAITKKLVELMGGTIRVESVYGKGSTFYIEVKQGVFDDTPSQQKGIYSTMMMQQHEKEWKNVKIVYPKASILVVDDVEMNLQVARGLLKKYKVQVDTALSGEEACAKVEQRHYDLIFMDHMMPQMDGIETVARIRETAGCEEIPIVILTANAIRGMQKFFMENGFQDFLAKPISQSKLKKILYSLLPQDLQQIQEQEEKAGAGEQDLVDTLSEIEALDILQGVHNAGGNRQEYVKILKTYVQEMPELITILQNLDETKQQEIAVRVHGIKGSSRIIGADKMANYAETLEHELKEGTCEHLMEKLEGLYSALTVLTEEIGAKLSEQKEEGEQEPAQEFRELPKVWWNKLEEQIRSYDAIAAEAEIKNCLRGQKDEIGAAQKRDLERLLQELDMMEYEKCMEIVKQYQ